MPVESRGSHVDYEPPLLHEFIARVDDMIISRMLDQLEKELA